MAQGEISSYFIDGAAATSNGYRLKKANIPFATNTKSTGPRLNVKLVYSKFDPANGDADFRAAFPSIRNKAANRFILHYFPEYYTFYRVLVRDKERSIGSFIDTQEMGYRRLRETIKDNLLPRYYTSATKPATESVVMAFLNQFRFGLTASEVETLKFSTGQSSPIYNKIRNLQAPAATELAYFYTHSPVEMKTLLTLLELIPTGTQVDASFELFNSDENITPGSKTTTLQISSFMADNKAANDGLGAYQQQLDGFEGSLPINLNFTDMQKGVFTILNGVIMQNLMRDLTDVHNSATVGGPYLDFAAADSLEITFGTKREHGDVPSKTCIASIKYFVAQSSLSQQHMRVGYMTNILYNKEFGDQLVLSTLKNYEFLVRSMRAADALGGPNLSFTDFLDENAGDFGLEGNTVWEDIPNPAAVIEDMNLKEAVRLGIIDLEDVKNLEKGFEAFLTPEQLERYKREVLENPEFQKKLKAAKRKMAFSTAKDINKIIIGFLEGSPEGMGIKKNSPLGQFIRKIGIQELAMEAMICATFGLAPSFARIGRAAQGALEQTQAGIQQGGGLIKDAATDIAVTVTKIRLAQLGHPPKPPKPSIKLPKVDKKMFEPPTLDKELWESLKKSILDSLMKGAMEVIKGLAALLKELCKINNPYAQDEGATDVGDLVRDNLDQNFKDAPAISNESALDQMFGNDGLTPEQVLGDGINRGYLSDLSVILTSMEICFLFTDRSQVTDFTLDKIVDFNLTYPDLQIQQNLNTPTAVLSFFANLSRFVDITDLCNKIATDLYNANIDNICLVEEKAPELIDKILEDLATNGMELDSPFPYNLQCPLREDYINNPLVSSTIPSFLGSVQEAVEIEFVNGLSAALQILKEPVITSSESTAQIAGVLQAAGLIGGTGPGPDQFSEFGPDLDAAAADKADDIMKKVTEVFETIEDKINHLDRYCDVGALLGVEGQDLVGVTQTIISVLLNFVRQGDFINAIRDLNRRLSELSAAANSAAGLSSVATQYEFPVSFREDFASYIDKQSAEVQAAFGTFSPVWNGMDPNINLVDTKQLATRMTQMPVSQEFGHLKATSHAPTPIAGKFMPLTLDYRFPTKAAPFIEQDGNLLNEITGLPVRVGGKIIPKFVVRDSNTPDDYLRLTFLPASSAGADVQFSMNSDLFGNSFLSQFSDPGPLSRDYSITSGNPGGTDINTYVSPFTNVLYSKLRSKGVTTINGLIEPTFTIMAKNPDAGSDFDLDDGQHASQRAWVKGTISSILFPALYAGQTEAMFDFIQRNGIFDTPRLESLKFFFDNRSCIPDNVADLLDMGPGTNACGPSILDEVNEELLQALCHDGADPDDLNPQGTQIRDVVRHFSFLVLLQIHIAQFVVKNIFVFSAFEIDDLMTLGTIKEFMAVNIRNQVQKLIETKPIVGENLVKYYNKKIQRAPVINQGGLLDTDGNVVFPPTKRFRQSDVPAIIEYMTKDRITKSRCAVANAVKRSSDLTSPKDFDRVFVEDVLTVVPSFFGARILGTQYTPNISSDQPMIQVRQQNSSTGISENGFYGALHTSPTHDPGGHIDERTALMNNIPSYFGGSEGVLTGNWVGIAEPAKWRGFDRQMKYGKIVLERQVIWDSVTRHGGGVPSILAKTTGAEYGLEKDLFEQVLYNEMLKTGLGTSAGVDLSVPLEFTNLRFKYNIVYYMPTVHSPSSDQPQSISDIFSHADPFYSDTAHGTRADHKLWNMELSRYVLTSLNGHLPLRSYISTDDTEFILITQQVSGDANLDGITAPGETVLQEAWQNRPVLKTILSEYGTTVSDSELQLIVNDAIFKDYFDKSINRSVTSLVPILENFYLTSNFFPKMDNILQGAKDRCLGIYIDSILNQTPQPPGRTVSPQALAAAGLDPEDPLAGLTTSARDFILKMLIETPINILRGIAETMDPHVGISKIIRDITAAVFNEMAKGMDMSPPVKFLRDGPTPQIQQGPPGAQQEGPAYADNAPAGTQMYTYDNEPELEYARVPGGEWMVRKRGFTTKWTPLPSGGGATGINTADLEQYAEPLNAVDYYSLLPEQLLGLVEYKIPGDVVNDYATFTNRTGDETFWATRKRAGNTSWENATRVTSPTLIQRLADNAVPRYSTAQHGTTLNQADLDAAAAEIQASLAELPASRPLLSFDAPGPDVVNEDVRILQVKLTDLAAVQDPSSVVRIGISPQGVDGRFGPSTKASVKQLQAWASIHPMTGEMDGATWDALEQALTQQAEAHLEAQAGTGGGLLPNIKGENIMNLLFCLLEMGMQDAATGFNLGNGPKNSPDWENFVGNPGGVAGFGAGSNTLANFIGNPINFEHPSHSFDRPRLKYVQGDNDPRDPRNTIPDDLRGAIFPKFSMDGVDFTGTLLGLLMLPPGPFGIVYLLLMLLGKELEDALTPDEDGTTTDGPTNVSEEQSGERC